MADHLLLLMSLALSGSLMAVTVAFFRTLLKKRSPESLLVLSVAIGTAPVPVPSGYPAEPE